MPEVNHYWNNRSLCDVLEEMRVVTQKLRVYDQYNPTKDKAEHYAFIELLIEEAQSMGNRMEAGLSNKKDLAKMDSEWHELRSQIRDLRREKKKLLEEVKPNPQQP